MSKAAPSPTAFEFGVLLSLEPMEAEAVDELPRGKGWLFEPKYDGFRCLAFRDGDEVQLQSRNGKPLARYFPELAAGLLSLPIRRFVIDGEIVIPGGSFETLQLRLHPAASRVAKLAESDPATLIAFDMLVNPGGQTLLDRDFASRREALEGFMRRVGPSRDVRLSKATRALKTARTWLGGKGLDGIVAKRLDLPYRPGERAMQKFKLWTTIDCVVGGFYQKEGVVDSLLLGLYDDGGRLNYVGVARVPKGGAEMHEMLQPLVGGSGFTGKAPAETNRWSGKKRQPVPLEPTLVAEVSADHITADYMRHGARLLRWRTDKKPDDCTMEQLR